MIRLLHDFYRREYPGEYLLARLCARRGEMMAESSAGGENIADSIPDTTPGEWEQKERQWLYGQMNTALRRATAPVFFYFEIKTLTQCLRYAEAGHFEPIDHLVERSLMALGLKKILRSGASVHEVVERLERFFHDSPLPLRGLADCFREKGVQGCEEMIRKFFFVQALNKVHERDTRFFFQYFIALRNTLTVAKSRRWKKEETPRVAVGSEIGSRTTSLTATEDRLRRMIRGLTDGKEVAAAELHPVVLESLLDAALMRVLARRRRAGGEAAACIEYLLRSRFVAKNSGILQHKRWREKKRSHTMEAVS